MATYDEISKRTKNALKAIMQTVQYQGQQAFQSVLDNTTGEYDAYPILRILPGDTDAQKADTASSYRTIAFVFRTHLPLEATPESESATYDKMYDLTDLIIDTIEHGDLTGRLTQQDPDLPTWILSATRGGWLVNTSKGGPVLFCDIDVQVKYSRDYQ